MSGGSDTRSALAGTSRLAQATYGIGAVALAWFGAFALEFLTRMMANVYVQLGADLPAPTLLTLQAVRSFVPWGVAVAATLVLAILAGTANRHVLQACAAISIVVGLGVAAGGLALALPAAKMCGDFLPEWPDRAADNANPADPAQVALNTATPAGARAPSCR